MPIDNLAQISKPTSVTDFVGTLLVGVVCCLPALEFQILPVLRISTAPRSVPLIRISMYIMRDRGNMLSSSRVFGN
jgi:hypothetical protein